jgi:hypothetical protein
MDLSLLDHLSDRALREEAERRGLSVEGMERGEIVRAIRAHEGSAMTVPPGYGPEAHGDTLPPARAKTEIKGPVGAARAILDRVVSIARNAIPPRKSEPPASAPRKSDPPPVPGEDEPIRTRSMARVLEEQGHYDRALAIVRDLAHARPHDVELTSWLEALEHRIADTALRELARARLAKDEDAFIEITAQGTLRGVAWRLDERGIDRARALLRGRGTPTLRVVTIIAHPDHSVETRQEDRLPIETSGYATLEVPKNAKLVVSIGLSESGRYASIAHAAS